MEMVIRFHSLPEGLSRENLMRELADVLEDDGWLTGAGEDYVELELEDERANPKYGILGVRGYLQRSGFAPDTVIELAGTPAGIYD